MPKTVPAKLATLPIAGEDGHDHGDGAHSHDDHGDHGAFNIGDSIMSHNMPYPAWDPLHGSPIIVFDLGTHAAMKYKKYTKPEYAKKLKDVDGSAYVDWATEIAESPVTDFRYKDHQDSIEAGTLAKIMAYTESKVPVVFPRSMSWVNNQIFFGTFALLLFFVVVGLFCRRKPDQVQPQGRIQNFMETFVIYLRDEVIKPAIPHHFQPFVPFLVSMFFIILVVNLFGLIPGTGTMSGNIGMTCAWASIVFLAMLFFGIKEQGFVKFWINLVPIHFSWGMSPVWILLLVIELMGLIIKPIALAIRLFANMFAGHTVLLVFMSLGFIVISQDGSATGLASILGISGWLFGVVFHAMEVLVAFIQAYVFTMLASMFIGMSIHPEH